MGRLYVRLQAATCRRGVLVSSQRLYLFEIAIDGTGLAHEVRQHSAFPEEDEVLLAPNVTLEVASREEKLIRLVVLAEPTRANQELLLRG